MQPASPLGSSAWEAFRLTSKSPSELMDTLGPHGIDNLIRQALAVCWRELPDDNRTFAAAREAAREAFNRNIRHWSSIKKASPAAFFENLAPRAADGYLRQALVLCHMMLPRGHRGMADAQRIMSDMFERDIKAWEEDYRVLSGEKRREPAAGKAKPKVIKKPARQTAKKAAKAPPVNRRPSRPAPHRRRA